MQNPLEPIMIVLVDECRDAALDPEMAFDAYRFERVSALIKELPGAKATRFRVGGIARTFLAEKIDSMASDAERSTLAFLAACHQYTASDGTIVRAETHTSAYDQICASPDWIVRVADEYGQQAVYEIGRVARARAALPKARAALWG